MFELRTERLHIRPLRMDDLDDIYRILDVELAEADTGSPPAGTLEGRREWLEWTALAYEQLARLYQPPYGERAVTQRDTGRLIGAVGFVPCLAPFGQLPGFQRSPGLPAERLFSAEFGLYYAIAPAWQRQGYASEAAGAMAGYAFETLHLRRIVATTSYENLASQAVMRRLGMRLERNPFPDPPWFQVVGVLDNPAA
jgi:[ribosomal protein S5]-alanine N-acetyltransferase